MPRRHRIDRATAATGEQIAADRKQQIVLVQHLADARRERGSSSRETSGCEEGNDAVFGTNSV